MADEDETGEDETTTTTTDDDVGDIPLSADDRSQGIKDVVGQQGTGAVDLGIDPDLTEAGFEASLGEGEREWEDLEEEDDEFLDSPTDLSAETLTAGQADDASQVTAPTQPTTSTVDAEDVVKTTGSLGTATAMTGTASSDTQIIEADVTDKRTKEELMASGALSETITQDLAIEATVQHQLDSIYTSLDSGAELPAWASANMRRVQGIMNQRGLGASSMASAAMVQALMESALPIAESDAQRYSTIQIKNLDNAQKTALTNASLISARDLKNLDNRLAAAKNNADAFLATDIQNLKNEQVAANLTYQSTTQGLFNDQAAANVAVNLNAKSENDMNKYYDNLGAVVDTANANRDSAMDQFNVDQENSMTKYEAKLNDARDKFNSNMALLIDQSNVLWRRNINTVNNQGENAANQANAAAFLGITLAAQNQLWQQYRDEANMAFTAGENDESRALQLTLTSIANQFASDMFNKELDFQGDQAIGSLLADTVRGILDFMN